MMRNIRLLSVLAGAWLWACGGDEDDRPASTTSANTTLPGDDGTGNGSGNGDDGDDDDDDDDAANDGDGGADGGADGGDGDGDGGGEVNEVCDPACEVVAACLLDDPTEEDHADCVQVDCQDSFDEFPACRAEFEAMFSCIAGLSCDEFDAFMDSVSPYPCETEEDRAYDCALE